MTTIITSVRKFLKGEDGALVIALISTLCITVVAGMSLLIKQMYENDHAVEVKVRS